MGVSKIKSYQANEIVLSNYLKALAHPARIAIVKVLMHEKACFCGDIVERLPLAQATVSQHLKALKDANLITGEISGPGISYCLNSNEWKKFEAFFIPMIESVKECKTGCC